MILATITYAVLAFGAVITLCMMILRIGNLMSDCPDNGPAIRVGAVTIATGFAAIGIGGVFLIGTLLFIIDVATPIALAASLGLAALCLGLGFTQAITTLQAVATKSSATA